MPARRPRTAFDYRALFTAPALDPEQPPLAPRIGSFPPNAGSFREYLGHFVDVMRSCPFNGFSIKLSIVFFFWLNSLGHSWLKAFMYVFVFPVVGPMAFAASGLFVSRRFHMKKVLDEQRLYQFGSATRATVTFRGTVEKSFLKARAVDWVYTVDGKKYTVRGPAEALENLKVGDTLWVLYDPDKPSFSRRWKQFAENGHIYQEQRLEWKLPFNLDEG